MDGHAATLPLKKERAARKPRVVLPFGLQAPKRQRRDRLAPRGGAVAPNVAQPSEPLLDHEQAVMEPDSTSSSDSDTSSESNGSASSSSSQQESDSEPDAPEAIAMQIEDQAEAVVLALQEQPVPNSKAAATFFNSHVGVLELSLAPSGGKTAACYHCSGTIQKGSARYTYSYNIKRPWKYIHETCLILFLKKLDSKEAFDQAVAFCEEFLSKSDQTAGLRSVVSHLRLQLNVSSTSSSSRS